MKIRNVTTGLHEGEVKAEVGHKFTIYFKNIIEMVNNIKYLYILHRYSGTSLWICNRTTSVIFFSSQDILKDKEYTVRGLFDE